MPVKIKFIIASLAIVAVGFLAVGVRFLRTTLAQNAQLIPSKSEGVGDPEKDTDKDGLDDIEESYWNTDFQNPDSDEDGFLDGEEVTSGHDPLKQGPDDLLSTILRPQNLSDKVSSLVLGGLAEGSLKQNNTNRNASVNLVVDDILRQSQVNFGISPILPVTVGSTDTRYRTSIIPALEGAVGEIDNASSGKYKTTGDIKNASLRLQRIARDGQETPVPEHWVKEHTRFVYQLWVLARGYELLAASEQDPLQGTFAMQTINVVLGESLPDSIIALYKTISPPK